MGMLDNFSLLPSNVSQYLKYKFLNDNTFDEGQLSAADLEYLRGIAQDKIKRGDASSGIGYSDYGVDENTILKDGMFMSGLKSMVDPSLRMATLLGRADLEVEGDDVWIRDDYNFNSGKKREKYANLLKEGKEEEAKEFLSSLPSLEAESIRAYMHQPEDVEGRGVNILLGRLNEEGMLTGN